MRLVRLPAATHGLESQIDFVAAANPWAAIDLDDAVEAAVGP